MLTTEKNGILSFLIWKPWVQTLQPFAPSLDPLHCTLLYDRNHDEEAFEDIEGDLLYLQCSAIYIWKQDIAAKFDRFFPKNIS